MNRSTIVLLTTVFAQIAFCQVPTLVDTLADDMSPQGNIDILHLYDQPLDRYEIWSVDANDSTDVFLFDSTSFQNAVVIFSPNEQWVAENIEAVSNFRTVSLFKRTEGIRFVEVDSSSIYDKAISYLAKVEHLHPVPEFGHSIVELVRWLPNSMGFVMRLGGWDNPFGMAVSDWTCIFNVETFSIISDPNNHGKFVHGK